MLGLLYIGAILVNINGLPGSKEMKDIQQEEPVHKFSLNRVGVRGVRKRLIVNRKKPYQLFILLNMYIQLPENLRGANMSRFLEVLDMVPNNVGSLEEYVIKVAQETKQKHNSECVIEAYSEFPYDIKRPGGEIEEQIFPLIVSYDTGNNVLTITVEVIGASACPCSLENAGIPHMQRVKARLTIEVEPNFQISAGRFVDVLSKAFSTPVYGTLKRVEEATMLKQLKPRFIEDIIREVVNEVKTNENFKNVLRFRVEAEAFESIHPHNVYASWG